MTRAPSLDDQLTELVQRRDQCRDLIIRAMIDMLSAEQRIDVLLDRRTEQAAAETPGRMA